jgi:ADP-ribose pyrophosphatase YjhB (NUDIX family)
MPTPYDCCGYCGTPFAAGAAWPRVCAQCGQFTFRNPLPVAVVLVPVPGGLLGVRRAIEPGLGQLALPGGFINYGETWQAAAARELFEETGVTVAPESLQLFDVLSTPNGAHLLIFGLAPALAALPAFVLDAETQAVVTLTGSEPLAFTLHTAAVAEYFARA